MKIFVFSGNRADWSGLEWLGNALAKAGHEVTTYKFWESYEGKPNAPSQVAELSGMAFHEASNRLGGADLVFLAGDRYEVLSAAQAAYCMEIPIAHIAGGDVTLGSRDNAMRDAISMLASIHFVTNDEAGHRLHRMVSNRDRLHNAGSPAIDRLLQISDRFEDDDLQQMWPLPRATGSAVLRGLPQRLHAGVEATASIERRTAPEGQRPVLREHIQEARLPNRTAVPSVRVDESGDAPSGLFEAPRSGMALSQPSHGVTCDVTRDTFFIIVSVHPCFDGGNVCSSVLAACQRFESAAEHATSFILMSPNADAGNAEIYQHMKWFSATRLNSRYITNLPPDEFAGLLASASLIVGNSSAGIYEAPALAVPSVDVGERQSGRPRALSVQNVEANAEAIHLSMVKAIGIDASPSKLYGDGHACERIVEIISKLDLKRLRHAA